MATTTTPNLGLTHGWQQGEAGWGDAMNTNLDLIDAAAFASEQTLVVNVKAYGALGDGTTDDTTAIRAAITAMVAGSRLYFPPGKYPISDTIALKGDAFYDMNGAVFYKTAADDYWFTMTGVSNIVIAGGRFIMEAGLSAMETPEPAGGPCAQGTCLGTLGNSHNINIYGQSFINVGAGVSYRDAHDCWVHHTYSEGTQAPLVVIATTAANQDVRRIIVSDNVSVDSLDDFIAVGQIASSYNVTDVTISNNICYGGGITALLSGLIRVGNYSGGTGLNKRILISGNKMIDMNSHGIFVHDCEDVQVIGNSIDGYAGHGSGKALVTGATGKAATRVTLSNNRVTSPSTTYDSFVLVAQDLTDSSIHGNYGVGHFSGQASTYLENCQRVRISNNVFKNEAESGGAALQSLSGSDSLVVFDNDINTNTYAASFVGNSNIFSRNIGYDVDDSVSYDDEYVLYSDEVVTY
jgi:polygalacturonase